MTADATRRETARDVVTCRCGQKYLRNVRTVTFRDNDAFSCRACGGVLEEWNGMEIPVFVAVRATSGGR